MRSRTPWLLAAFLAVASGLAAPVRSADRPNVLWILSEDNSKHYLRLYDPEGAPAPHIERMAERGLVFDHAFSNAPVCSVARTTLMTSVYAPRVATQFHRKIAPARLPEGWRLFPAYLRAQGYHTTNNSKKDYNAVERNGVWDASSNRATWRDRPTKETPFFHMRSFAASHESSLHFSRKQMESTETATDPKEVRLFPYHPDTATFRYTHARYLDRMGVVDDFVGRLVWELEEDGLLEETFIFYFGDNGGVLPGSKGYIYESGLHVPLVIRIPERWKGLVDGKPGTRVSGFVSFVDFGATVLNLAGVPVPEHMDGRPFLGRGVSLDEVNRRDETFGYADRFDEKYDLSRSLRKRRYKYLRNYQAFYPDALQNNYRYKMLAYEEWRSLYRAGKLDPIQRAFFEPKSVEALYDIETDPHEVRNLAGDPAHAETLKRLRGRLRERLASLPDLSFYPESVLVEEAVEDPIAFGKAHARNIAELIDVADLSLLRFAEARPKLEAALDSQDPWKRYWALIACSCFGQQARDLVPEAKKRLEDPEGLVQMRAAEFLGILGAIDPRPTFTKVLNETRSPVVALLTLNSVVLFHDRRPDPLPFDPTRLTTMPQNGEVKRRLAYLSGEE